MFQYYATGRYSLKSLIQKAYDEGLVIPANFPSNSKLKNITKSTALRILRNPMYYGDFMWKGKLYHGVHESIVSRELWDQVQKVLDRYENKKMAQKYGTIPFVFRGLLTCGECGRTITAEKKTKPSGKTYIYYRCTHFNTECQQKPVREEVIDERIMESLRDLELPEKTVEYVTAALKKSLESKRSNEDRARDQLLLQKEALSKRMDALYEDKLDGNITQDFYEQKFKQYSKQAEEIDRRISSSTKADIDYYRYGVNILELAKKARSLYEKANVEERQELLGYLLSNSLLKDKQVDIHYKKPFDRVIARSKGFDMRERRDSNPRSSA